MKTPKLDHYAKLCLRWRSLGWSHDYARDICLLVSRFYPRNLRQYHADHILLKVVQQEAGHVNT